MESRKDDKLKTFCNSQVGCTIYRNILNFHRDEQEDQHKKINKKVTLTSKRIINSSLITNYGLSNVTAF